MQGSQLISQLSRVMRAIMAEAQPELERHNLSVRSFFVLLKIEEFPYPAQLAEQLLLPAPTISLHLRELEQLNYIKRELDEKDLRRYRIALTEEGQKALNVIQASIDMIVSQKCRSLSKSDQKDLEQIVGMLEKGLN